MNSVRSWEAGRKREADRFTAADLERMVDRLFVENAIPAV